MVPDALDFGTGVECTVVLVTAGSVAAVRGAEVDAFVDADVLAKLVLAVLEAAVTAAGELVVDSVLPLLQDASAGRRHSREPYASQRRQMVVPIA